METSLIEFLFVSVMKLNLKEEWSFELVKLCLLLSFYFFGSRIKLNSAQELKFQAFLFLFTFQWKLWMSDYTKQLYLFGLVYFTKTQLSSLSSAEQLLMCSEIVDIYCHPMMRKQLDLVNIYSQQMLLFSLFSSKAYKTVICLLPLHLVYLYTFVVNNFMMILTNIVFPYFWLLLSWVVVIIGGICLFEGLDRYFSFRKTIKRKFFHFLILFVYWSGLKYVEPNLLLVISFVTLYLLLVLEKLRVLFPSMFHRVNLYFAANIDERDKPEFILTHIFLLVGCFSSIAYNKIYFKHKKYSAIGFVVLGIGDSFASIFGSLFGKTKMHSKTKKSWVGFFAGFSSSVVFMHLFYGITCVEVVKMAVVMLVEGFSMSIDNLVLPVVAYHIFAVE